MWRPVSLGVLFGCCTVISYRNALVFAVMFDILNTVLLQLLMMKDGESWIQHNTRVTWHQMMVQTQRKRKRPLRWQDNDPGSNDEESHESFPAVPDDFLGQVLHVRCLVNKNK